MISSILGAIVGKFLPEAGKFLTQRAQLKHEMELEKLRGKIKWEEAKSARAERSEGRDADWEQVSIRNSGWKDEWVLLLLSLPLVLSFFPATDGYVLDGFAALESTPDWYRWLVMLIFTAIYGIRIWRRKA